MSQAGTRYGAHVGDGVFNGASRLRITANSKTIGSLVVFFCVTSRRRATAVTRQGNMGFSRSFLKFFYVRAEIKVVLRMAFSALFHPLLHHAVRPMTTVPFAFKSRWVAASQVRFFLCVCIIYKPRSLGSKFHSQLLQQIPTATTTFPI